MDIFKDILPLAFKVINEREKIKRALVLAAPVLDAYKKVAPDLNPLVAELIEEFFPHFLPDRRRGELVSFDVRWLQESLNKLGYQLVVDGIYGSETKGVVAAFQHQNGLVADGWAGILTCATIVQKLQVPQ